MITEMRIAVTCQEASIGSTLPAGCPTFFYKASLIPLLLSNARLFSIALRRMYSYAKSGR